MPDEFLGWSLTFEILPAAAAHGQQCPGRDWMCAHLLMKLGALRPLLQWLLGCSSPGLQIFLNAHTVRPP